MTYQVVPVFPSPLIVLTLDEDFSALKFEQEKLEYRHIFSPGESNSFGSVDQYILEKYPKEKQILLNAFNTANGDHLGYSDTKFKVTTSWITKTPPGGYSSSHNHGNSFMSGILYYGEYTEDTSPILFGNQNFPRNTFSIVPSTHNHYNNQMVQITPTTNLLLIFPSYLYHKIGMNNSSQERYSLAFNIIPTGEIGSEDSRICIQA